MTDRELMQQALDALCQSSIPAYGYRRNELRLTPKPHIELYQEAIEALRARLAQPEPEPVAWHEPNAYGNVTVYKKWAEENGWLPLYKERT